MKHIYDIAIHNVPGQGGDHQSGGSVLTEQERQAVVAIFNEM